MTARKSNPPWMTGKSRDKIAPMIRRPTPGIEKTCSMMTAPPSSAPATMPIDRQDRDQGVGQAMAEHDLGSLQTLGVGSADEVLIENFEHRGARHPGDEPDLDDRESQSGQDDRTGSQPTGSSLKGT